MAGISINNLLAREIPATDIAVPEKVGPCELEDGLILDEDFIKNIEREFIEGADDLLKSLNLYHLKVTPENEG